MKRVVMLVLFFIILFSFEGVLGETKFDKIWEKEIYFEGTNCDWGIEVLEVVDEGYILMGTLDKPKNSGGCDLRREVYLAKFDEEGDMLWNYSYGILGEFQGFSPQRIISVNDGYVIVGGTTNIRSNSVSDSPSNIYSDIFLLKVDKAGNKIWNKTFGGKYYDYGYSVISVSDGLVVVGSTQSVYSGGSYNSSLYLLKLTNQGEIVWSKTYDEARLGFEVLSVDGEYIIFGQYKSTKDELYLLKLDSNGNKIFSKRYEDRYNSQVSRAFVVDGDYVVLGDAQFYYTSGANTFGTSSIPYLTTINFSGEIVSTKNYSYGISGRDVNVEDAFFTGEDFLINSWVSTRDNGIDAYFVKADADGELIWNKTYGGSGADYGYGIILSGEDYVLTGAKSVDGLTSIYLTKINATSEIVCGNGDVESGEECDDGNLINGDGCNSGCEKESGGDFNYWADMNGQTISVGEVGDVVRLISNNSKNLAEGSEVEFEVWDGEFVGRKFVYENSNPLSGKVVGDKIIANWPITLSEYTRIGGIVEDEPDLRFHKVGEILSSSNVLTLSDIGDDEPMFVSIVSPECGANFSQGTTKEIMVNISDADDLVNASLFVDGVNVKNFSNGLNIFSYKFDKSGSISIVVNAINSRGKIKRDVANVMIVNENIYGVYVAACISRPGDYEVVDNSSVRFGADGTRGLEYSPTTGYSAVANSSLVLNWTFDDGRKNPYTLGNNSLAWNFYKSFIVAGEHSAILNVEANV